MLLKSLFQGIERRYGDGARVQVTRTPLKRTLASSP